MTLVEIIERYWPRLLARPGVQITIQQRSAIHALLGCRTEQYGTMELACRQCAGTMERHLACGHRFCNQCQHHNTRQWLARQQQKRLPVRYFLTTFTLPYELRVLAQHHPRIVYAALFQCAANTLQDFGLNSPQLKVRLGLTAVLHTHTRRLDYHPHVHVVVPGGGVNQARKEWRKLKGNYLFNGRVLAKVFRAQLLTQLRKAGLTIPTTPQRWIVQCQDAGHGESALKYLSRYLYRGVLSNRNLVSDDGQQVTFQYTDSDTNTVQTRTLPGEDFLLLLLQHVLPTGFRRVRDYGFLHGNAKALLKIIQWVLRVNRPTIEPVKRACFRCPYCQQSMVITNITRQKLKPG